MDLDRTHAVAWITDHLKPSLEQVVQLDRLVELLRVESERQNLVSRGTLPHIWSRHILDGAQLLAFVPRETSDWLDLGSGAGLPGIPCAILRPDIRFVLAEQRPLRAAWLDRLVSDLCLTNVAVEGRRVERLPDHKYAVISARAFAPLPRLMDIAARFSTNDTFWLLPKGRSAPQELEELRGWRHLFHVEQSITDPEAGIIVGHLEGCKR